MKDSFIDSHIHTYPTADVGTKAPQGTGRSGHTGTVEEYVTLLADGGIEAAVMVNMTPVAEMREAMVSRGMTEDEAGAEAIARMRRRNAWTCEVARQHPQLVPFISVDPSMGGEEAVAELTACLKAGARGVKLHPANQRYEPSDKRLCRGSGERRSCGSVRSCTSSGNTLDATSRKNSPSGSTSTRSLTAAWSETRCETTWTPSTGSGSAQ